MINQYDIKRLLFITKSKDLTDLKHMIKLQLIESLYDYTVYIKYLKKEELEPTLKRFVKNLTIYKIFLDVSNGNDFIISKLDMDVIRSRMEILSVVKNKDMRRWLCWNVFCHHNY
jgi:hypothetical protein